MIWEGYEFDEGFRPDGFEDWAYDQVNVGYAFYLRDKYVTDDTGLYEDKDSGTIHIFCPHTRETFEAGQKEVFGEKETAQTTCTCGKWMVSEIHYCPREKYCGCGVRHETEYDARRKICILRNAGARERAYKASACGD